MRFTLKRGDTSPPLAAQLLDVRGRPLPDLDVDDVVLFFMVNRDLGANGAGEIEGKAAVVTDLVKAMVEYRWDPGDTDVDGVYDGEFRVNFFGGGQATFPNGEYINVVILPDIASNLATPP